MGVVKLRSYHINLGLTLAFVDGFLTELVVFDAYHYNINICPSYIYIIFYTLTPENTLVEDLVFLDTLLRDEDSKSINSSSVLGRFI